MERETVDKGSPYCYAKCCHCLYFLQKQMAPLLGNVGGTVHLQVYLHPKISGRMHILQNSSILDNTNFQCFTSGYMRCTNNWTMA